jgi:hypothetical protein
VKRVLIALCVIAPLVHAQVQQSHPIEWPKAEFAGRPDQRVAMLVTPKIDGHSCRMQLDTGAGGAVIWRQPASSKGEPIEVTVEFAGITKRISATPETKANLTSCPQDEPIATLGNAFFDHGTLSIDLKASRLSFVPKSTLATQANAQRMLYSRTRTQGHTLVEMKADGAATAGLALLDTGSVALDLGVLSKAQWDKETNGAALQASERVRSFAVPAWGQVHTCYATEGVRPFSVDGLEVRSPTITFCPSLGFEPSTKLEGILGMHPFRDAVITLDYPSGLWLVENAK